MHEKGLGLILTRFAGSIKCGMPRKLRLEYGGAIYHVMNCGDRREPIFADDKDRGVVSRDARAGVRADRLAVSCLCLMHNHFHLVAETPPRKPGGGDGMVLTADASEDWVRSRKHPTFFVEIFSRFERNEHLPTGSRRYGRLAACATIRCGACSLANIFLRESTRGRCFSIDVGG